MEPISARPISAPTATPGSTATERFSSGFGWSLLFCLILGGALRLGYIDHHVFHVDEQIARSVVQNLSFPQQWDTNWAKCDNHLRAEFRYDQFNFSSYHYVLYFWKNLVSVAGLDCANHPGALRALNGLFGLVFIGTIALVARQTIGEMAGIAAAAAAAVIPLLVEDAHYLRCEAMLTAGMAVLLWLSTRRGTPNRWILPTSGFLLGWLVACKATMGLALPIVLIMLPEIKFSKPGRWQSCMVPAGIAGLGFLSGIVLGMPWAIAQPHLYFSGLAKLAAQYRSPAPPFTTPDMAPSIGAALAYMKGTLGWSFWAVTALGLGKMITASGWWRTALVVAPLAAACFVFGVHPSFGERNYSPFLPIAAVLFGAGLQLLIETIVWPGRIRKSLSPVLLMLLLACSLALPALYSCRLVFRGFSGLEQQEKNAALVLMQGNLTGKMILMYDAFRYAENEQTIRATVESHESALVVVYDFNDRFSPACLASLQNLPGGRILGVSESIFPDVPPCSLNTMISPRLWLLYISAK